MAEEMELIGGRMRERREELRLTQREVADLVPGKTEGKDVSRWERGLHRPNSDTLSLIAKALETDLADLYAGPVAKRKSQRATPNVLGALNGDSAERLARMEDALERVEARQVEALAAVAEIQHDLRARLSPQERGEGAQERSRG